MRTLVPLAAITLALSAGLAAQIVSPVGYAHVEAGANNTDPFRDVAFTFQQVHGDIRGTPRSISSLAFRRDGTVMLAIPARTVVLDMFIGEVDMALIGPTFAANFTSPRLQVVTNRTVNLPDHTVPPITIPTPFTVVFPFDVPYAHSAALDLIYEMRIHSNSNAAFYALDAAVGNVFAGVTGTAAAMGTGCTTSNGVMQLRWSGLTTNPFHLLKWDVVNAPTSAQIVLLVGLPIAFPLPGVCEQVFTTGQYFTLQGTTSTAGVYATPTSLSFRYNPTFAGLTLATQAASFDTGQPNAPLVLSNGLLVGISDLGAAVQCARVVAVGTSTATTGTVNRHFATITEFR